MIGDMGRPRKIVFQYDFYTGELLDEYVDIEEAAYDNYIKANSIRRVICDRNGVIRTPYGKTVFSYEKKCTTNGN